MQASATRAAFIGSPRQVYPDGGVVFGTAQRVPVLRGEGDEMGELLGRGRRGRAGAEPADFPEEPPEPRGSDDEVDRRPAGHVAMGVGVPAGTRT